MQALEISGLKKTYPNGFEALKGINLSVKEGDFFALLGPNGAGKSTTIGIICSLVNKSDGQVKVFGHDLDSELLQAKQYIGIVPQEFNFNIFEPVIEVLVNQAGYYGIERKEAFVRAEKLLKQLELWEKRRVMARELSGGMKRRMMIARALMHDPKLLILDEPTAGVDIEIRRSMWRFLKQINAEGTTIILTTHYLEEAEQLCRNIAIIDEGQIIKHCSIPELLNELDVETFVLSLEEAVQEPPRVSDYVTRLVDSHTLEVEVSKANSLNQVFAQLSEQNLHVLSMRNKSNRLEELFLRLVGDK